MGRPRDIRERVDSFFNSVGPMESPLHRGVRQSPWGLVFIRRQREFTRLRTSGAPYFYSARFAALCGGLVMAYVSRFRGE